MTRVLLALALIVAVASSVAGAQAFPNRIELPDGFSRRASQSQDSSSTSARFRRAPCIEETFERVRALCSSRR